MPAKIYELQSIDRKMLRKMIGDVRISHIIRLQDKSQISDVRVMVAQRAVR